MTLYESLFMVNPDLADDRNEHHLQSVQDLIARSGGEGVEVERWGKKRLAYRVGKHRYGTYFLVRYRGGRAAVEELERHFRIDEEVLKFMTVRIDERRLRKEEEMRKKRAEADAWQRARRERGEGKETGEEAEERGRGEEEAAPSPRAAEPGG